MPKSQPTTPLARVLPRVLKQIHSGGRPTQDLIDNIWMRIVGQEAARNSWPRRLMGGRLVVEVGNSGWLYTLNPKKQELLQGLMELLGAGWLKSLSFRIGERKDV